MKFITAKDIGRIFLSDMIAYRKLFEEDMLIIDDLGVEPKEIINYGNAHTPVIDLITERYDKQKMTVVTSNLQGEDISRQYGSRIRDRFREMLQPIVFTEESFR